MDSDNFASHDYAKAWDSGQPFNYIKAALYMQSIHNDELYPEYPNDEVFNTITAKVLAVNALKTNRTISVNYKWEPLDDNIVIYSLSGKVLYTDVSINDEELGFIIKSDESDSLTAFPYKKIFWLEEAD